MRGHVIVCGLGQVGYRVASLLLRLGESVTIITLDSRPQWHREVEVGGARILHGDARDESKLLEAGVETAKALIACADQDLVNLEVSLDARRLAPQLRIVARLFDQNLAGRLEESLGIDRALAMSILAAPAFAAAAFGEEVLSSFSIEGRVFLIGRFEVDDESLIAGLTEDQVADRHNLSTLHHESRTASEELGMILAGDRVKLLGENEAFGEVAPRSYIAVKKVAPPKRLWQRVFAQIDPRHAIKLVALIASNISAPLRAALVLLLILTALSVAVFSFGMKLSAINALYFVITTVTTTGYGDINLLQEAPWLKLYGVMLMILGSAGTALLYSIVTDYIVTNRFQQLAGLQRIPEDEHVIVVGLGNVGYRTVAELDRIEARVVGIDSDASTALLGNVRSKTPVIIGDAREEETLRRAGIEKATAVIAVTSSDAVNLSVGLLARRLNPKARTVIRTFDAGLAQKVEQSLDIDVAMSASLLAAPTFAAASLYENVVSAFEARGRLFVLCTAQVDHDWAGRPVSEVERQGVRALFSMRGGDPQAITNRTEVMRLADVLLVLVEREVQSMPP